MIQNKGDLKKYIELDLKALGLYPLTIKNRVAGLLQPSIWKFQVRLRKMEYLANCCKRNKFEKIIFWIRYRLFESYGYKMGFTIPINVFGPGLCICHIGTIIINDNVKVGNNCRIHAGVNIGNSAELGKNWVPDNTPIIGDNVYIGPGAKIFGKITIGSNVRIGANAVVNKDVTSGVTVGGIPAKIISETGSYHGLQVLEHDENTL